tara:strand:- start:3803 stop:5008 length:1206 start_codon:yes stop_codon:yes gene_type:complete
MKSFEPLGAVVEAKGAWLTLSDGRRILDGISSWWVTNHGHSHPKIAKAISDQAHQFDQVILADFGHGPAAQLAERLADILPGELQHVFYSDDGSTSVEVAIKMTVQARANQNEGHRKRIVTFDGAYHGDTVGAMSVSARGVFNEAFQHLLFDVDSLPYNDIPALQSFFAEHGAEVNAVIVEPLIQGAGGMRFSTPDFIAELDRLCEQHGAYWIADEVMTGLGRAGTMFAVQQANAVPDVICVSKGITGGTLPLGLTICNPEIYARFLGADKSQAFLHGHSYTGNPIACAAALASLELFQEEQTLDRVAQITSRYEHIASQFAALPNTKNIRYRGGIFAYEVDGGGGGYLDPTGRKIRDKVFEQGLYIRPLGNTVYLMPPFCISTEDLDWALGLMLEATRDL